MFRQSMAPRKSTASSDLKSRQLTHLNSQIAQLQANISDMDNLLRVTVVQADYIKKLGIMHSSLFMASHKVFEEEAMNAQEYDEEEESEEQQPSSQ